MKKCIWISILLLTSCGGMRTVDLQKLLEKSNENLSVSQKEKIKLKEELEQSRESEIKQKSKTDSVVFENEKLKVQNSTLTEKLNSENSEGLSITGATGTVEMTENGKTYKIPSDKNTVIAKNSLTKVIQEKAEMQEKYDLEKQKNTEVQKESEASKKEAERLSKINESQAERITDLEAQKSTLSQKLDKYTKNERSSFAWLILAFVLGFFARLLWTTYGKANWTILIKKAKQWASSFKS